MDFVLRDRVHPSVQTHLYDHLTPTERRLEVKPPQGANDAAHQKSAEAFAAAESAVAEYGVAEWADRLLEVVRQHRIAHRTVQRPILFICHSTGGTVVKQALSKKANDDEIDITRVCLGITFFATPHHGSSVLSEPEYVQTVQAIMGLKWEMSNHLRHDFILRNPDLESLNYKFAVSVIGMKIYSYVESVDTNLLVLSSNDAGGESITTIRLCIVDSRSGKLGTPEVPLEDEEVVQLNTTHVGAPRFQDEDGLYNFYLAEIAALIGGNSEEERTAYQTLNRNIMTCTEIDVHQFYGESGAMKILSAHPSLQEFLENGPAECMNQRIRGSDPGRSRVNSGIMIPAMQFRRASSPVGPTLTVTPVDQDDSSSEPRADSTPTTLSVPAAVPPKNIHTRRPSLAAQAALQHESPGYLAPKKQVQFNETPQKDTDKVRPPQRTPAFKLPSRTTDRFKWIHVPFNHSGWVPLILTTISQEKDDLSLHSKLLLDKIWFFQHNRSRHASPHARFVRPSVKCLLPEGVIKTHSDGLTTPTSAGDDIQFVLYIPYLHWDSFGKMQKRAEIIKRRRQQADARPIARDVAHGKSMEHKIIWQYLSSDRPVHCRRTLDQYGYPSLRNTTVRDGDQILYKRTKPEIDTQSPSTTSHRLHGSRSSVGRLFSATVINDGAAKVLMVDQLWLWIIDNHTIVTFFASKEKEDGDNGLSREGDLRSTIYQDINGDYANQCSDPFDFAALVVSHAVKALLDNTSDRILQIFRIFEEYISILTERLTSSFKEFRNNHRFEKTKDIKAQRHVDNRRDLDALLELRDIEDELNTIDKLIKEQQGCVAEMITQYNELNLRHGKGLNGINFLHDVNSFLAEHKEQLDGMLKSAQAAQKAFKELLDMKQKQANIVEAHLAREQTEVAADQSRSVMIFTIFTIIFLPLSFIASVFGINSREWSSNGGSGYLPLQQIFTYMISISLAVIVIALLVAFSRHTRRLAQKLWRWVALPLLEKIRKKRPPDKALDSVAHLLDLEKANLIEIDRTAKKLSAVSRTYSKLNFDEELWSKSRNNPVH